MRSVITMAKTPSEKASRRCLLMTNDRNGLRTGLSLSLEQIVVASRQYALVTAHCQLLTAGLRLALRPVSSRCEVASLRGGASRRVWSLKGCAQMKSLYEHAGGDAALHRLEELFYDKVLADPVLKAQFTERKPHHVEHLTWFTAESFGAPDRFTRELGFQYIIN